MDFISKYYQKKELDSVNETKKNTDDKNINKNNEDIFDDNKNIKNELINEKNKNKKLIEDLKNEKAKNEELRKELEIEKEKNKKLNNLYQDLMYSKKNIIDELNSKIKSLELNLKTKKTELDNLKKDLKNPKSLNDNQMENIMAIAFTSIDQKFIYALPCKNTDKFVQLEMKLYEQYPQYTDENTYFTFGGKSIKRFKTLKENGIKCSDVILLNVYE